MHTGLEYTAPVLFHNFIGLDIAMDRAYIENQMQSGTKYKKKKKY